MAPKQSSGETVAESVRRALLDAILYGDLAPPVRLFPAELAPRFGVSITPVREALARLASEGFIEAIPRHGYHVRLPSSGHITDLWSVRLALELMAAETVLHRFPAPPARHEAMQPLRVLHAALARRGSLSHREHTALNGRFHDTIFALADNALLTTTYEAIRIRLVCAWVQRGSRAWRGRLEQEQAEHQAILDALEAGQAEAVNAAIRRHLARSLADAIYDLEAEETKRPDKKPIREKHHEAYRLDDARTGSGAAALRAGRRRADRASDAADVDLPEPGGHQPAREGPG